MSSDETAPSEQSMESFDFFYDKIWTHNNLSEMRQDGFFQNRKPWTFYLTERDLNEDHSNVILELFSYFHEKGIIWEELKLKISSHNERYTRPLLHAVNTMKIFKIISLELRFGEHDDSEVYSDLCPGLASNTFTEELDITCGGNLSRGYCLALNNLIQTNAPCLQRLELEELSDFDFRWILPGLRDNKTLKTIRFDGGFADLTDATISAIVAALGTNPSLEVLNMTFDSRQIGDLTSEALKTLLTNSTSLRELLLCSHSGEKLNAECIIQGLKNSCSLKRLSIYGLLYGDLLFTRFFRILPSCPLMECIELFGSGNNDHILSEEDLVQVTLLPRLPRPIKFHLNPWRFPIKRFIELLRCHPEVRIPCDCYCYRPGPEDGATREEFIHAIHMNWHGRYLLDRPNVPLSIWPLVLEKVDYKSYYVEDQANVIYELLQGPAWGKRTSF